MSRPMIAFLLVLLASACSWVKLESSAEDVLVLPAARLTPQCQSLGKVTVSVLDKVGVLERHKEEVVEDLHVLARNHAAQQGGDTVVPLGEVKDGAREYEVWRCTAQQRKAGKSEEEEKVEVLPYTGD